MTRAWNRERPGEKTLAAMAVLLLSAALALAGCGGAGDTGPLSETDYVNQVTELYGSIQSITADALAEVDTSDSQAIVDATQRLIQEVQPIYEELGALEAPEKYAQQQEKIKAGCDASVETMKLSVEVAEMAKKAQNGELDGTEVQTRSKEIAQQMSELQSTAADFTKALAQVEEGGE